MDKKQKIGLGALCVLTGLLEAFCIFLLIKINMIPLKFMILIILAMVILLAVICTLMFMPSKHKFGKRKIASTILIVITIISCLIGVYFMNTLMNTLDSATSDEDVEDVTDPIIVYISGSDTREMGLEDSQSRSDVNILAVINPETHQILLINTPRDSYIENPYLGNAKDKLTHCSLYGVQNSIDALEQLYDLKVDYYCYINFEGVITLVDAVGGVDIVSDKAFTTYETNVKIKEGTNHLGGYEALQFVRERYAFADGDFSRGENQMKFIKALGEKLASGTALKNYSKIMKSMDGMFETSVPQSIVKSIVKTQLKDSPDWNIKSFLITGSIGSEYTASDRSTQASVVYPDEAMITQATLLANQVINGEILTDEVMETETSTTTTTKATTTTTKTASK